MSHTIFRHCPGGRSAGDGWQDIAARRPNCPCSSARSPCPRRSLRRICQPARRPASGRRRPAPSGGRRYALRRPAVAWASHKRASVARRRCRRPIAARRRADHGPHWSSWIRTAKEAEPRHPAKACRRPRRCVRQCALRACGPSASAPAHCVHGRWRCARGSGRRRP